MKPASFNFEGNCCQFYHDGEKNILIFREANTQRFIGIPNGWTPTTYLGKGYLTRPIFTNPKQTRVHRISYVQITLDNTAITEGNTLEIRKTLSLGSYIEPDRHELYAHLQNVLEKEYGQVIVPEVLMTPAKY